MFLHVSESGRSRLALEPFGKVFHAKKDDWWSCFFIHDWHWSAIGGTQGPTIGSHVPVAQATGEGTAEEDEAPEGTSRQFIDSDDANTAICILLSVWMCFLLGLPPNRVTGISKPKHAIILESWVGVESTFYYFTTSLFCGQIGSPFFSRVDSFFWIEGRLGLFLAKEVQTPLFLLFPNGRPSYLDTTWAGILLACRLGAI